MVVVDRGQGAEEEAADVGEDGGAAGRDASFGEEIVESAEGVIDALRILEFGGLTGEGLANIQRSRGGVVRTKLRGNVRGEGAALTSGYGAMLTTSGAG
jgi:hypothetical protein